MARYLVTGGAGFIGSAIVAELVARGERVRVLDDFSSGRRENLAGLEDRIEPVEGDVGDVEPCQRAVAGVDYVLHHAALCSVAASVERPLASHRANVTGTLNLLVAARDAGAKRFVYAASASAYGRSDALPLAETTPAAPQSPYAIQKYAGELYCRAFWELYGLETVALRYFNVFGPRQDPDGPYAAVIPRFVEASLRGEAPVIFGDGQQTRDFVFVADTVQANLAACAAPARCAGSVLNIARGESTSLLELAKALREIAGGGEPPRHEAERPADIRRSLADIGAAREVIGWAPAVSLEEGLERTVAWYRSRE